jgi:hypothetical protein
VTWFDTGGNLPPHQPQHTPAPEPDQEPLDDPERDFDMEGRCEWCLGWLPDDLLCRCPGSLADLEQTRLELRYEEDKER